MRKLRLVGLLLAMSALLAALAVPAFGSPRKDPVSHVGCVNSDFTVDTNAVFMNRESREFMRLRHHIVDNKVGGVILFRSQVWAAAALTNRLQEMAKVPLLISADLEMGMGMRFDNAEWWPPNMAVAAGGKTLPRSSAIASV